MYIKFKKRFKRRQMKGLRARIRSDLTHKLFDDANNWFIQAHYRYYYYDDRRSHPKHNLHHNNTRNRFFIRRLRTIKSYKQKF